MLSPGEVGQWCSRCGAPRQVASVCRVYVHHEAEKPKKLMRTGCEMGDNNHGSSLTSAEVSIDTSLKKKTREVVNPRYMNREVAREHCIVFSY
ncbi:hypothetical protein C0Q70_01384 [Pomacea canaliculata]|uniref:Uncharacterized protein n=1 Tax=Pomacea canaliculata TaxID=400727 RepID=A0A2T7PZB8_POMCA|nr:hypothetical protein C0Q70_01384 [Pomacea canaliculata]